MFNVIGYELIDWQEAKIAQDGASVDDFPSPVPKPVYRQEVLMVLDDTGDYIQACSGMAQASDVTTVSRPLVIPKSAVLSRTALDIVGTDLPIPLDA